MWLSQNPRGGSQSRHVAFTFCAGGPAGPSLAIGGVKSGNFLNTLAARVSKLVCTFFLKTRRQSSSMWVNCTSHAIYNILLDSCHTLQSEKKKQILIWKYRQTGGEMLWLLELRSLASVGWQGGRFCMLAAPNNNPSTAAPTLLVQE